MTQTPLPAYQGDEPSIFVSYSHADEDLVGSEIRWLQDQGFNVWWDEGISPGAEWREEVTTALGKASLILYFVSPASVVSPHCVREINYGADHFRKPILAVHIAPTELPHGLGLILSDLQALFRHTLTRDDYYQKLAGACASYLNVAAPQPATPPRPPPGKMSVAKHARALGVVLLVIGVAAGGIWWLQPDPARIPHARFSVQIPAELTITPKSFFEMFFPPPIALSPDGSQLVFSATDQSGETALYIRLLNRFEYQKLAGTEGGVAPFFSPDGQWVGFAAGRTLKKVPIAGGQPQIIVPLGPGAGFGGASWSINDRIAYAPSAVGGLFTVPAAGGSPERISTTDAQAGELGHVMPQWDPTGRILLLSIRMGLAPESPRVAALDPSTGERHLLLEGAIGGRLIAGRVIYGGTRDAAESLWAAPFSARSMSLTGEPERLLENVAADLYALPYFDTTLTGSLIYIPVSNSKPRDEMIWLDADGAPTVIADSANNMMVPGISPDGRSIVLSIMEDTSRALSVWTADPARGSLVRFVTEASNAHSAIWSPDGSYLVFTANHEGPSNLYRANLNAPRNLTRLTQSPQHQDAGSFSPDGRLVTFAELHPETNWDLWVLDLVEGTVSPFLNSPVEEMQPIISPLGDLIAYTSKESGQREVYIERFPGGGSKRLVSNNGGEDPVWSHDGRKLYYRWMDGIFSAPIDGEGMPGNVTQVLSGRFEGRAGYGKANWDIDRHGRILVTSRQPQTLEPQINVILGWPELTDE